MSARERQYNIRRIVVALDASPHSYAALEAAVSLAAQFEAELLGLYVEDINILRLAEHPFVREVGSYSSTSRRIEARNLERQLRIRTLEIQRRFNALTTEQRVRQDFRVTRGRVASEIRAAASDADVLIVGKAGWSQINCRRLGSTARAACEDNIPDLTMILQHGTELDTPLMVVYDGSLLAQKALEIATSLMQTHLDTIHILLVDGVESIHNLRKEVTKSLQEVNIEGFYRSLTGISVAKLTRAIQNAMPGTLIIPASISLLSEDAVLAIVEAVEIPTLLVR